ncbi:MAG: replication restart helicase PriA [Gammaproteobacteria bacterium]|nr:replication restart helicase PriA [Gammaproteobacteria bacterium]
MTPACVFRVALDTPLKRLFDYLPPESTLWSAPIEPGMRVRVPFGRQKLIGIVMEAADSSDVPPERLKPILEVLDPRPVLDASALALLRWAAEYYHHPIGEVLSTALPKAMRMGAAAEAHEERWSVTPDGREAWTRGEPRRAPKQRELLGFLVAGGAAAHVGESSLMRESGATFVSKEPSAQASDGALASARGEPFASASDGASASARGEPSASAGDGASASARGEPFASAGVGVSAVVLDEALPNWRDAARSLATRGWVLSAEVALAGGEARFAVRTAGPDLREEQRVAVDAVGAALGHFGAFVLHGVTGSGKTEVYLRLVERVLQQGRRALVLVPEIGLTPQLVGRFRDRFDTPMAVLHSALTDSERLTAWRQAFSGHARIMLGTRSAVFAPVPDLGIIIVDEEHDSSFKQHEGGFRYSARDLAVVRAQRADVPVLLGSATPALESLQNVAGGRYVRLALPYRAAKAEPPRMSLVDLRSNAGHAGVSTPAIQAIERHLRDDGQVLVFLNRRGYAPTLLCTACGWIAPCRECDARLTVHLSAGRLRCHHCGFDTELPSRCPQCGFAVKPVGQGTERIEESLASLFPGVALARLDRDVVRRRGDMEEVMRRMSSGEARILVGTQMVTKGHDFPNVTLVVVLNADQGLFSTDFRAPERLAQTIVQVAGRAGRGTKPGEVLIQTEFPGHPLLLSLLSEGYDGFARTALTEREQASWPPFSRLAAVRDSAKTAESALEFLTEARKLAGTPPRGLKLLGPVPAAMSKRAGRYHAQLLIEGADRSSLHHFLDSWLPAVEQLQSARRVRWALDVDPIELF